MAKIYDKKDISPMLEMTARDIKRFPDREEIILKLLILDLISYLVVKK